MRATTRRIRVRACPRRSLHAVRGSAGHLAARSRGPAAGQPGEAPPDGAAARRVRPRGGPYLRKILVNTRRSWWRSRWRQGSPAELVLEVADPADPADRYVLGALVWAALPRL